MRRGGPAAGGFSLLELVVVIVIIGLLAAMGVPKVSLAVEEKRVETAKNGLYTMRVKLPKKMTCKQCILQVKDNLILGVS